MESNRQKKIARLIQKDLSEIFLKETKSIYHGFMISITHVFVSKDLSNAKIYLSIFPKKTKDQLFSLIQQRKGLIRHQLSLRMKNQTRKTPALFFYIDNSIEHYETIDKILKENQT
tara:strand:- start:124 stop:471 length:348 start_codon:yes stop_codon:yes gene_type:complete